MLAKIIIMLHIFGSMNTNQLINLIPKKNCCLNLYLNIFQHVHWIKIQQEAEKLGLILKFLIELSIIWGISEHQWPKRLCYILYRIEHRLNDLQCYMSIKLYAIRIFNRQSAELFDIINNVVHMRAHIN